MACQSSPGGLTSGSLAQKRKRKIKSRIRKRTKLRARAREGVGGRAGLNSPRRLGDLRASGPSPFGRVHEVGLLIFIVLLILFLIVILLLIFLFFGDFTWPFCRRSCLTFNRRLTEHQGTPRGTPPFQSSHDPAGWRRSRRRRPRCAGFGPGASLRSAPATRREIREGKRRTGITPYGHAAGTSGATGVERFRPRENADYRGGVTCLYDTQPLGACLHASECGGRYRPQALRGMPDVPIAPPATGPPEGWVPVGFLSPASFNRGCGRVCLGFWVLDL